MASPKTNITVEWHDLNDGGQKAKFDFDIDTKRYNAIEKLTDEAAKLVSSKFDFLDVDLPSYVEKVTVYLYLGGNLLEPEMCRNLKRLIFEKLTIWQRRAQDPELYAGLDQEQEDKIRYDGMEARGQR